MQRKILGDYKKIGQRLVPPLIATGKIIETSFINETLPRIVWITSLFRQAGDRAATHHLIEFLTDCKEALGLAEPPNLVFIDKFGELPGEHKTELFQKLRHKSSLKFILEKTQHFDFLFKDYPMSFLFQNHYYGFEKDEAVSELKADVSLLLDRYSLPASKTQVAVIFTMNMLGNMHFPENLDIPDPNIIFEQPDSEESKRLMGFVRATLNAFARNPDGGLDGESWSRNFWTKAFSLEECY